MSAMLRKALFWLVMLALPLHGMAAASMGSMHVPVRSAAHLRASMSMNMDSGAATTTVGSAAATDCPGMLFGCDQAHGFGLEKCGLSAVCGLVAGPVPEMPVFVRSGLSRTAAPAQFYQRAAFCTGAPDRPPRSLA